METRYVTDDSNYPLGQRKEQQWRCPNCEQWNVQEARHCKSCGDLRPGLSCNCGSLYEPGDERVKCPEGHSLNSEPRRDDLPWWHGREHRCETCRRFYHVDAEGRVAQEEER